jgi:hypothetical protein
VCVCVCVCVLPDLVGSFFFSCVSSAFQCASHTGSSPPTLSCVQWKEFGEDQVIVSDWKRHPFDTRWVACLSVLAPAG